MQCPPWAGTNQLITVAEKAMCQRPTPRGGGLVEPNGPIVVPERDRIEIDSGAALVVARRKRKPDTKRGLIGYTTDRESQHHMSSNTPGISSSDSHPPPAATLNAGASSSQAESPASSSAVGGPASPTSTTHHNLRKRPAASSSKQHATSSATTGSAASSCTGSSSTSAKLRKVSSGGSSGSKPDGPSSSSGSSSSALPPPSASTRHHAAGGDRDVSEGGASSSSALSSGHHLTVSKKNRELSHLTDYFPDQVSPSGGHSDQPAGRLTRSRTRAMASSSSTPTSSNTTATSSSASGAAASSSGAGSSSSTAPPKSFFAQGKDKITKKGRDLLKKANDREARKDRHKVSQASSSSAANATPASGLVASANSAFHPPAQPHHHHYADDQPSGSGSFFGGQASGGESSSVSPAEHLLEPTAGGSARTTPYVPTAHHGHNAATSSTASTSLQVRGSAAPSSSAGGSGSSSASSSQPQGQHGENTNPSSSNPGGSGSGMSRGTPQQRASSFLSGLVPRMQHLLASNGVLGGHPGSGLLQSHGRYANILEGLRSTNDIRQTEAATDLAELLLMGNEESLPNLPVREIIQQLNVVMQRENNLELTLLCVRCVSNMLEAAPRAINVIVDCIPTLLLKLKHIECIDIAEQTLIALEVMSRRNAKSILHAGGFSDAVMHVDFFSMPSQRLVYQIAANCASHIHPQEFNLIRPCLSDLIQKLTFDDKRCCESICLFFCRLIDNCCRSPERLRDIAGPNYEFLSKVQQLLTIQPSTLNSLTFVSLLQSLKHMCMRCTDIVSALIDMEFGRTLRFLIVGTDRGDATVDVNLRSPQHTREIVSLVGELLPPLPKLELFEISLSVQQYMTNAVPINVANGGVAPAGSALPVIPVPSGEGVSVVWQYVNEAGELVDLTPAETTLLEQARNNGEPEVAMELNGQPCYFDMIDMEYTNQLTNFIGRLDRRIVTIASEPVEGEGTRDIAKEKHNKHLIELVSMVFPLLVEIGSDTSCANLRYESTRVMMHMMYAIESESQLKKVLNNLPLATYIASLLSSNRNHCVTVSALQLVHVMLDKLPRLYVPLFESEGVFHMIKVLDKTSVKSSEDSQPPKKVINLRRGPIEVSATPTSSSAASSSSTAAPAPIVNDGASSSAASSSAASSSQASDPNAPSSSSASAPGPSSSQPLTIQPIRNHNMYEHNIGFGGEGALGNAQYAFTNGLMEMQTPFGRNMGFRRNTNFGGAQPFDQPFSQEFTNMFYRPGAPGSSASGSSSAHHSAGSSSNSVNSGTAPQVQSAFLAASSFKHILDDRIKAWVSKEAQHIIATYHGKSNVYDLDRGTITELKRIARNLASDKDMGAEPLEALKTLLLTKDVSSFQLNHSFLTSNLINYLTDDSCDRKPHRIPRLRLFCKVFMGIDEDNVRPEDPSGEVFAPFDLLVHKVANAVGQLEQFQVKVTNLSGIAAAANSGIASNSTPLRGSQALKLFQSNQIRCNLKRHPSCKTLREWRHGRGSIKVDPFTAVSAIERYLVDRGVGQNASESSSDNEDETEEETDLAPGDAGSPPFTGRIEIVINEHRVPSDLSVLQAIFKYSMTRDEDSDSIPTNLWTYNHTMYYRAAPREDPKASSSKQKKSKKQHTANYLKAKPIVFSTGQPPQPANSLTPYLSASLTKELYDPCAESCVLLRILYGLNTYWYTLYDTLPSTHAAILPATAFHSSKLVSKVQRQLSDFLCVATQSIPEWTTNIVEAVPFLFPFAVRRNLLYCTAFGRDRAILHLVTENSDEQDNDAGSTNRLLPRIERRRVTVKRNALLADAVITFQQMGTLEAQLEVNFDGEVGTGFGPTLEFYSTISKEIQKHSHGLWAGVSQPFSFNDEGTPEHYTVADNGLYPKSVNRAQHKLGKNDDRLKRFEFVGRLLAQALLDSRMLDIPLSSVFFKWLINQEDTIGSADLEAIDATIYKSLRSVTLLEGEDDVAALDQVFTMPGDDAYELIKNGKNEAVNKENVRNFVDLVTYWRLVEGVREEMHALRRGFEVIIDPGVLRTFAADEIEGLFCGCSETSTDNDRIWSKSALQAAIRPDHGYTHESPQIGWLVDMLHGFSLENRRKFLQFCTGSPRLPIGGFRGLNPALTVVRKIVAYGNSEGELPSAMTCYNFLKIPPYSNYETFVERFQVALQFIYSFHLT